jgi:hypothetical protein
MKYIIAPLLLALSGCSTIGNLEVLNDTGLREVREVAATISKMDDRRNTPVVNTGAINRKYGEVKGLNNRKYNFNDIPLLLQSLRYITE